MAATLSPSNTASLNSPTVPMELELEEVVVHHHHMEDVAATDTNGLAHTARPSVPSNSVTAQGRPQIPRAVVVDNTVAFCIALFAASVTNVMSSQKTELKSLAVYHTFMVLSFISLITNLITLVFLQHNPLIPYFMRCTWRASIVGLSFSYALQLSFHLLGDPAGPIVTFILFLVLIFIITIYIWVYRHLSVPAGDLQSCIYMAQNALQEIGRL